LLREEAGDATGGRVEQVVGAAVGDARGQAVLGGGGAGREVPAEAEPETLIRRIARLT
jgi:hypothetical protein